MIKVLYLGICDLASKHGVGAFGLPNERNTSLPRIGLFAKQFYFIVMLRHPI